MKDARFTVVIHTAECNAALPLMAKAQSLADSVDSSGFVASTTPKDDLVYTRPTQETKMRNYFFDTFGPYPFVRATVVAGIGQMENTPAEWQQGTAGYSRRFGSDLGIGRSVRRHVMR